MTTLQRLAIAGSTVGLTFSLAFAAAAKESPVDHGSLSIGPRGQVQLRGTVSRVDLDGKVFVVKVWGADWTVKVNDATKMLPRARKGTLAFAEIQVGHVVTVSGATSAETPLTVAAKRVIDQSVHTRIVGYTGKITALVSPDAFTFQIMRGGQLTVKVTANTKIWAGEIAKAYADIAVGTTVKVRGAYDAATNTLNAVDVRIPAAGSGS
ncbi:MAG: DUF5666 domain-containing protein [bacterium]|nr:DUF5666 domain-containing protein [bacterium]